MGSNEEPGRGRRDGRAHPRGAAADVRRVPPPVAAVDNTVLPVGDEHPGATYARSAQKAEAGDAEMRRALDGWFDAIGEGGVAMGHAGDGSEDESEEDEGAPRMNRRTLTSPVLELRGDPTRTTRTTTRTARAKGRTAALRNRTRLAESDRTGTRRRSPGSGVQRQGAGMLDVGSGRRRNSPPRRWHLPPACPRQPQLPAELSGGNHARRRRRRGGRRRRKDG